MATTIITTLGRQKMVMARAGDETLAPITKVAFGSGGVDSNGNVLQVLQNQTELNDEITRKEIDSHQYLSDNTVCKYKVVLDSADLIGVPISELAIVDSDDDIIAIKNFLPKSKDSDVNLTFYIDDIV